MPIEDTVKHLWDCAQKLDAETHTAKLLKSYYMNTCRIVAHRKMQIPKEKFAVSKMCPRCGSCWQENDFKLKLQPQHLANNAKARKLITKLEASRATKQKGLLSKKQRRRATWLQKRVSSNVEIRCGICQERSKIKLQKPKKMGKTSAVEKNIEKMETETVLPSTKKKKKHKKDKSAGLEIPKALQTANSSNMSMKLQKVIKKAGYTLEEIPSTSRSLKQAKKEKLNSTQKLPISATVVSSSTLSAKKSKVVNKTNAVSSKNNITSSNKNANLSQTLKAKKKKKSQTTNQLPVTPKILSKTQKSKSLLQLAALLKTQSSKTDTKSTQNRLESLLK